MRRRRVRPAVAACLLSAVTTPSCRLDAELVEVPADGVRAAIVAAVRSSEITLEAVDLPEPDDLRFPVSPAFDDLYLLGYGCPLEGLGLAPGPIPQGGARPLRPPLVAQRRAADGAWVDAPRPIMALDAVRLAGEAPSRCLLLESDSVSLPGTEQDSPEAVVGLGGERVLIATSSGRGFEVDGGAVREVRLSTSTAVVGLFRAADADDLVAIGEDGSTFRGTLAAGLVRGPSLSTAGLVTSAWVDGGQGELFVLTSNGHFDRLVGDVVTRLDPGDVVEVGRGGVVWLGPGEAVAVGFGSGAYSYYSRGTHRRVRAELATADDFVTLARVPEVGVVAGTSQGYLFRWLGGQWGPLDPRAIAPQMRAITGVEGRLVFGGSGGTMWQLVLDDGELCEPRSFASSGVRFLVSYDGGFFIVSRDRDGNQPTVVSRLRPTSDACGPRLP